MIAEKPGMGEVNGRPAVDGMGSDSELADSPTCRMESGFSRAWDADDWASLVTISIATKDRSEVLEVTLRNIHAFGLGDCPLIICDDGSEPPLDSVALNLFPNRRLLRNERAQGQALARNRIAAECSTPYLLQLDDDSYPAEGDLSKLIVLAKSRPDWLAIALPFEEPARDRSFPLGIPRDETVQVQSFVGCSALLNIGKFTDLGGYSSWIGRTVEEEELCIRGLARGYPVISIDLLRIRHEVTDANRNCAKIARRTFRNWFLLWCLHGPALILPWRIFRLSVGAVLAAMRQKSPDALVGLAEGIRMLPHLWSERSPVSMSCYRRFRKLPHALDYFVKNV